MSHRPLAAAVLLAALLGSAGCSSTPSDGKPSTSDKRAADQAVTLPKCPTLAELTAALGLDYTDPVNKDTGKARNCSYAPKDITTGLATVHFEIMPTAAESEFNAVKTGYRVGGRTTTDVTGLGDHAFTSVLSAGGMDTNTTAAHKGRLQVLVTSRASLDQEKALVAQLLG